MPIHVTPSMPRLIYSSEKHGCGATIELDSSEVVVVSIAQMGVLVYLWDMRGGLLKRIISSNFFWSAPPESRVFENAQTARALSMMFPDRAPALQFKNPVLAAFSNAIWHCGSAAEVCTVLNEAAAKIPGLDRSAERDRLQRSFEDAKNYKPKRSTAATYQIVYSDGVTQATELLPDEIDRWVTASNKAEADKPYRIVRMTDAQGRVVWSR